MAPVNYELYMRAALSEAAGAAASGELADGAVAVVDEAMGMAVRAAGELERRTRSPREGIRDGEDDAVDVALEHGADAHRTGLAHDIDRQAGERRGPQPFGSLAERADDGMRGRIATATDAVASARHHGIVEDGDGAIDPLTGRGGGRCLGKGGSHVELVVHRAESYTAARAALPSGTFQQSFG
jgi:hypothetical protein